MAKELEVHFNDGETETRNFPESLQDIPWPKYQKLERKIKMNAELDRDGQIKSLTVDDENMGDFFVDIQEQMAKMILEAENIDINDVTTRTVKKIIQEYGNDMEEFGMKLKKKREK